MPATSSKQRAGTSSTVRASKRQRSAVKLAITIPVPLPTTPARVPSSSRHVLNAIRSNGRPVISTTSSSIRAGHARDHNDAPLAEPQRPHDTLIPIDPILLADTAALFQTPARVRPPRSFRRDPSDTENQIPPIESPTHPEPTDLENVVPQTHWPPEEPGKSWNSYVPRTPIPIRFRNNTADKPERPLNPTVKPMSGLRRSARLNLDNKPSEALTKGKDASSQKAPEPTATRRRRGTGTKPEASGCFWRNCEAKFSDLRSLVRHLDTHFPGRFECMSCHTTFTRPLNSLSHKHSGKNRSERVIDPVPYWQNPEYKEELRRPEEGHFIWGDAAYEENNLQWYHDLPKNWKTIQTT